MKAYILIDYSNDFIAEDGKLTCGLPGREIENNIAERIRTAHKDGDLIVFAMDYHRENEPDHPETKLFPPHNIEGTKGRELYGLPGEIYEEIKGERNVLWMDKRRYSSFCGTPLDLILREKGIDEVILMGVCTDICILHTAVDAYNLNYKITVYENCTASFNEEGHRFILSHLKNVIGADVIS